MSHPFAGIKNIGILCRGRSLRWVSKINNFKHCFIVNDWNREMALFEHSLMVDKSIIHALNADRLSLLNDEYYTSGRILRGLVAWTKKHMRPAYRKRNIAPSLKAYRKLMKVDFIPEELHEYCRKFGNTGLLTALYVSHVLGPKHIWIAGLDFYSCDYLVMGRTKSQLYEVKHKQHIEKMVGNFVFTVKRHPNISYHMVTEYKDLPELPNLEVVE